jgi:hypothetical protein
VVQQEGKFADPKVTQFRQRKREVQCAVNLSGKLDDYKEGFESTFRNDAVTEANELSDNRFGATLLAFIGSIYIEKANARLSSLGMVNAGLNSFGRWVLRQSFYLSIYLSIYPFLSSSIYFSLSLSLSLSRSLALSQILPPLSFLRIHLSFASRAMIDAACLTSSGVGVTVNASKLYASQRELDSKTDENGEYKRTRNKFGISLEDENVRGKVQAVSASMITMIWHLTRMDVVKTLDKVIRKVLDDKTVDPEKLTLRAKALLMCGEEYQVVAPKYFP